MAWLILGLFLWSAVHLLPSVAPQLKQQLIARYSKRSYRISFALLIVLSLLLIVLGWRSATPIFVYEPPIWGRHLTMLLMLVSFVLFAAAKGKSCLRQIMRHPMLVAVLLWALAHLLANGDSRSLVLFLGMAVWAITEIICINRHDGAWKKREAIEVIKKREVIVALSGLVSYALLVFLHPYFTGVSLLTL